MVRAAEAGSANDPEAIRKTIGPGLLRSASGSLPIPSQYLAPRDGREVTTVGFDLVVTKNGGTSRAFARTSSLEAVRRVVLRTEIGEQDESTKETR